VKHLVKVCLDIILLPWVAEEMLQYHKFLLIVVSIVIRRLDEVIGVCLLCVAHAEVEVVHEGEHSALCINYVTRDVSVSEEAWGVGKLRGDARELVHDVGSMFYCYCYCSLFLTHYYLCLCLCSIATS
jgi:hypothetical protein